MSDSDDERLSTVSTLSSTIGNTSDKQSQSPPPAAPEPKGKERDDGKATATALSPQRSSPKLSTYEAAQSEAMREFYRMRFEATAEALARQREYQRISGESSRSHHATKQIITGAAAAAASAAGGAQGGVGKGKSNAETGPNPKSSSKGEMLPMEPINEKLEEYARSQPISPDRRKRWSLRKVMFAAETPENTPMPSRQPSSAMSKITKRSPSASSRIGSPTSAKRSSLSRALSKTLSLVPPSPPAKLLPPPPPPPPPTLTSMEKRSFLAAQTPDRPTSSLYSNDDDLVPNPEDIELQAMTMRGILETEERMRKFAQYAKARQQEEEQKREQEQKQQQQQEEESQDVAASNPMASVQRQLQAEYGVHIGDHHGGDGERDQMKKSKKQWSSGLWLVNAALMFMQDCMEKKKKKPSSAKDVEVKPAAQTSSSGGGGGALGGYGGRQSSGRQRRRKGRKWIDFSSMPFPDKLPLIIASALSGLLVGIVLVVIIMTAESVPTPTLTSVVTMNATTATATATATATTSIMVTPSRTTQSTTTGPSPAFSAVSISPSTGTAASALISISTTTQEVFTAMGVDPKTQKTPTAAEHATTKKASNATTTTASTMSMSMSMPPHTNPDNPPYPPKANATHTTKHPTLCKGMGCNAVFYKNKTALAEPAETLSTVASAGTSAIYVPPLASHAQRRRQRRRAACCVDDDVTAAAAAAASPVGGVSSGSGSSLSTRNPLARLRAASFAAVSATLRGAAADALLVGRHDGGGGGGDKTKGHVDSRDDNANGHDGDVNPGDSIDPGDVEKPPGIDHDKLVIIVVSVCVSLVVIGVVVAVVRVKVPWM